MGYEVLGAGATEPPPQGRRRAGVQPLDAASALVDERRAALVVDAGIATTARDVVGTSVDLTQLVSQALARACR